VEGDKATDSTNQTVAALAYICPMMSRVGTRWPGLRCRFSKAGGGGWVLPAPRVLKPSFSRNRIIASHLAWAILALAAYDRPIDSLYSSLVVLPELTSVDDTSTLALVCLALDYQRALSAFGLTS